MKRYPFIIITIALIFAACSTQKNSFMSRNYHNLTAHFNVFFNGKESFKEAEYTIENEYRDDYTHVLPVFKWPDKDMASSVSSNLDRAMEKAVKCIKLHSIKSKPKNTKSRSKMTDRDKEFYKQNEFNKWIDDCYMMIGMSHFYKTDYDLAEESFKYVLKEFKDNEVIEYQAMIWLIRSLVEQNEWTEATEAIELLKSKKEFKELLDIEFYTTYADYFMKQKNYKNAIEYIEKSIEKQRNRKKKKRYIFILAQIYQETGQLALASEKYKKVIRMNPPYEMAFNAQINRASCFLTGSGDSEAITKQLNEMLKDEKNEEFKDQIYYALGNIEYRKGNVDKALEYYKLSAASSVDNNIQKTTSFLSIADIYYARREYMNSGIYYDSASQFITEKYPDYSQIKERTDILIALVEDLNNVYVEDSLQKLAAMSEKERMKVIDQQIEFYNKKQRELQLAEMQRLQDRSFYEYRVSGQGNTGSQGKWYFYNPSTLNMGLKEFAAKWGKRQLEDNWRRKNKDVVLDDEEMEDEEGEEQKEKKKKKEYTPTQREYYLQHIPLNDTMLRASDDKIIQSLYDAGNIYQDELKEYEMAIEMYEELVKRYPMSEYASLTYYQLYKLSLSINDNPRAERYKSIILSNYPNSVYAKVILDPSYLEQLARIQNRENNFYEQTYGLFQEGQYPEVIKNADFAINNFKKEEVVLKMKYLKLVSEGRTQDIKTFRDLLRKHIREYPEDGTSMHAKSLLAYMDEDKPDIKKEEEIEKAKAIYTVNEGETQYLVMIIKPLADDRQLIFNVINFNLDNFDDLGLTVTTEQLTDEKKMVLVNKFKNKKQAMNYYSPFMDEKAKLFDQIQDEEVITFIIAESNFTILKADKDVNVYLEFFNLNYQK